MVDNNKSLICPACHSKMIKVPVDFAGVRVDVCANSCGGIFFDTKELEKVMSPSKDLRDITKVLDGKLFIKVDETATRICPLCGNKMVKNSFGIYKDVQIDECYNCGGKFLDYGELETIRQQKINSIEKQYDYEKPVETANDWLVDFVRSLND